MDLKLLSGSSISTWIFSTVSTVCGIGSCGIGSCGSTPFGKPRSRGVNANAASLAFGMRYKMVSPDNIDLQYIMGDLYVKTLRCEEALPYLEKVLAKDDTFRNAQKLFDKCRRVLGKNKKKA